MCSRNLPYDNKPIKGISSIKGTSLITVTGLSMVGVIGVNRRIFTTLANKGISVFMVSQASSENSTSIGVRDEDAEAAAEVLNAEFAKEIETGAMFPMQVESGLATIAIVGENMKQTPGIAGKLFGTLGRSGISVIACAQGASETNISFVVDGKFLRRIHLPAGRCNHKAIGKDALQTFINGKQLYFLRVTGFQETPVLGYQR